MARLLEFIQPFLQLVVLSGIFIIIRYYLKSYSIKYTKKQQLKEELLINKNRVTNRGYWFKNHIEQMMILAYKDFQPGVHYHRFIVTTLFFSISVFVVLYLATLNLNQQFSNNPFDVQITNTDTTNTSNIRLSLVFSIITMLTPYMILKFKYLKAYAKASYDLLEPTKLIIQYSHLSIDKALLEAAKMLPESNVLKNPLLNLGQTFTSYRNEKQLNDAVQRFISLIGTAFAAQFGNILLYAEREGNANMKSDFTFLQESMEKQRETILEVKSNSRDAIQMGIYVNLLVFVSLMASSIVLLRPQIYLKFQFQTPIGLTLFGIIVFTYVSSVIYSIILARPKLDY